MPYKDNQDLPENVKNNLPEHAQDIYRESYNNAWKEYKDPKDRYKGRSQEETAHAVAWSAVENKYKKNDKTGDWEEK